jgi:H+/Cl- antiporter ClcA
LLGTVGQATGARARIARREVTVSSEQPAGPGPSDDVAAPDPERLIRSREYRRLLLLSGLLGVLVSLACWAFLELVHWLQVATYKDLPQLLGFETPPPWWPLPTLAVAGLLVAVAVTRLPGHGGHEPSEGLHTGGPTEASELPGVVLAALATISLGMVLGPEAPLIALGTGVAMLAVDRARQPVPDQARTVLAAAAGFAALATIFGSPVIGAVIIIEAAGLAGPTLPLILLPGLMASGIGSLVFVGIGRVTGLSSEAYALPPLTLPAYPTPRLSDFAWVVLLSLVTALVVFVVMRLAHAVRALVARQPFVLTIVACLLVGVVAVVFAEITGQSSDAVLFSGQEAMTDVLDQADTLSIGTLLLLLVFKAVAWGVSLGSARGGPTFPAIFLGLVGGVLCAHLPALAETPAVGALVAAAVVSVLRLPLSAVVLALLITGAGAGVAPLVIVAVVVAYIATLALAARQDPGVTHVV